jgi:hypothetical protein
VHKEIRKKTSKTVETKQKATTTTGFSFDEAKVAEALLCVAPELDEPGINWIFTEVVARAPDASTDEFLLHIRDKAAAKGIVTWSGFLIDTIPGCFEGYKRADGKRRLQAAAAVAAKQAAAAEQAAVEAQERQDEMEEWLRKHPEAVKRMRTGG